VACLHAVWFAILRLWKEVPQMVGIAVPTVAFPSCAGGNARGNATSQGKCEGGLSIAYILDNVLEFPAQNR
jgi:hypothetical protein